MTTPRRDASANRSAWITTLFFAVLILVPCFVTFSNKLREFVALARGDVDGAFAITPIVNYLLASLGFLFLFLWGIWNGMFRSLEEPKRTLLENERLLDDDE